MQALTQRLKNNYRQIHSTCLSQLHPSIYGPSFDLPFMVYLIEWPRRTRSAHVLRRSFILIPLAKLSCNDASHDVINRTAQDCVARLVLVLTRPSLSLIVRMACNQKCTALCLSRSLRSLRRPLWPFGHTASQTWRVDPLFDARFTCDARFTREAEASNGWQHTRGAC